MNTISPLHADKYALNMTYAHWKNGTHDTPAVFDLFYRKAPFGGNFAVFVGMQRVVEYIQNLKFTEEDIEWMKQQPERYSEDFINFMKDFRFTGQLYGMREGQIAFPNEPMIKVIAPIYEALTIEAALLNFVNFQSLIATKAARIKMVAGSDMLMAFGTRRAQEADAAIWGDRAAFIAGFHGTSNMLASRRFDIPAIGTMAHAWVQSFIDEETAFMKYAEFHPNNTTLLVDTYDTLGSGLPNAIKVGKWLEARGSRLKAIRLDSGDLAHLSIQARKMLDDAGLNYVKIIASNDLDEFSIKELKENGARIDAWGIGTKLITADPQPAFGGVYKLAALKVGNEWKPVIKLSETKEKVTIPGNKHLFRCIYERGNTEALYDVLSLSDPPGGITAPTDYTHWPLLSQVLNGTSLCSDPDDYIITLRNYHEEWMKEMPDYIKTLNPTQTYPVKLDNNLSTLRKRLIAEHMVGDTV